MRKWLWPWLIAEAVLYVAFLAGDGQGMPTGGIKLLAMGLCVAMAAASKDRLITAALLLSLVADVCLLFYAGTSLRWALLGGTCHGWGRGFCYSYCATSAWGCTIFGPH